MATLATTTLGTAVTAGATAWPLAAVTGVTIGSVLFCDGEAALVTGQPLGLSVPVQRGMLGSTVTAHGSGLTVYLGTPSQFYQQDPSGTPPTTLETDPWINTISGEVWASSGGQWVLAGGSGAALSSPVLSGTVTGTYTLGGTPTLASSAGVPYAAGLAAGYKIARGITALDGANPTPIVTGLTTIVGFSAVLNRSTALTAGTAFVTYGTITGGSVDVYGWVLAGTASAGTENVAWVAVGT